MSWTKGHITEQQIHEGAYTREAKTHNDFADALADKGVSMDPEQVRLLAEVWAARQQAYAFSS